MYNERHAARLDSQERKRQMEAGKKTHERLKEKHGSVTWTLEEGKSMEVPKCPECGGPMPVNIKNIAKCQDCGEVRG